MERLYLLPFLRASRRKNRSGFTVPVWVHISGKPRCELSLGYTIDINDRDETARRPIDRPDLK